MLFGKQWYTLEEASSKYLLDTSLILKWADQGVVRTEQPDTRLMQVNAADLEMKIQDTAEL